MNNRAAYRIIIVLLMVSTLACNLVMIAFLQRFFYGGLEIERPSTFHRVASSLGSNGNLGYQDYLRIVETAEGFESLAAVMERRGQPAYVDERVYWMDAGWATGGFASLIGTGSMLGGRFFNEEDDRPGAAKVAVVNATTWEKFRPGQPFEPGEQIYVKGVAFEVIGVVANGFPYLDSLDEVEIWIPALQNPDQWQYETDDYQEYQVVARLDPADRAVAGHQVDVALEDIEERLGFSYTAEVISETDFRIRRNPGMHRLFLALTVVTGFLFALGAINQLLMLVTRSVAISGDLKIMVALGAKSRHVLVRFARGFFTLLAVALACVALSSVAALKLYNFLWGAKFGAIPIGRLLEPLSLYALGALILLLVALHLGFPLLMYYFRGDSLLLRARATGGRFSMKNKLSVAGVALQIALVVFTVFGSAAFLQSLREEGSVEATPFDDRLLFFELAFASKEPEYNAQFRARLDTIKAGLMELGGIESMGTSGSRPLHQGGWTRAMIEGEPLETDPEWIAFDFVTPGYFETLGLDFLEGQDFQHEDALSWPHRHYVINKAYADRHFEGKAALGRKIAPWDGVGYGPVVGVVENAPVTFDGTVKPCIYIPFYQNRQLLNVRLSDAALTASHGKRIEEAIRRIDPEVIVVQVDSIESIWKEELAAPRLGFAVLTSLSLVGLALSMSGAFGYQTYMMMLREREFAVRHALGQASQAIFWSELARGAGLLLAGLLLGCVGFYAGARFFGAFFFGIELSPVAAAVAALLLLAAFLLVIATASFSASKPKLAILMRE